MVSYVSEMKSQPSSAARSGANSEADYSEGDNDDK